MTYGCKIMVSLTLCGFLDHPVNVSLLAYVRCVSKNIHDIFDCNLKTNYQILIIFDKIIPNTTCHQMTVQFPTKPNVCFCTT